MARACYYRRSTSPGRAIGNPPSLVLDCEASDVRVGRRSGRPRMRRQRRSAQEGPEWNGAWAIAPCRSDGHWDDYRPPVTDARLIAVAIHKRSAMPFPDKNLVARQAPLLPHDTFESRLFNSLE